MKRSLLLVLGLVSVMFFASCRNQEAATEAVEENTEAVEEATEAVEETTTEEAVLDTTTQAAEGTTTEETQQ